MQDLKEQYQRLLSSKEFNKKGFFSGAFIMSDISSLDNAFWQLDFYNEETNLITTYSMEDPIKVTENSEVFKEEKTKVNKINLEEMKSNLKEIIEKASKIIKEKKETPINIIIILQEDKSLIWNISYMTSKLNLVNIKISASDGKVLNESTEKLMSFSKNN